MLRRRWPLGEFRGRYRFQRRGPVRVKGKGVLETWFLVARDAQL